MALVAVLFVPLALMASRVETPLWLRCGVPKEALESSVSPPSAAKWLWNADEAQRNGGEAHFRRVFELASPVRDARVRFKADDVGDLYLNGQKVTAATLARQAVPGTNVLAVFVRNKVGLGGMIFRADFSGTDGGTTSVVSDRRFRSAAKAPPGWMSSSFDDSAWKPALEQGDVSLLPWSRLFDVAKDFDSPEEYAALTAWRTNLLPCASLAAEPEPQVRVVYRGTRPFINVNGRDLPPYLNLAGAATKYAISSVMKTAALGFPFFELQFEDFAIEKAPGEYDFVSVDQAARQLLHAVPNAYVFLRFRTNFPKWCAVHPEACVGYGKGPAGSAAGDEHTGRALRPSAASAAYRAELTRFHDALGVFVRTRPWAKRVVALRACWGVYTEWHTFGFGQCPDVGPAMTSAFRRFAGGKYAQEEPPTPAECERAALLLDSVKDAKTLDFFRCVSDETVALQRSMARDLKRNFPGRLVGAYSGYAFTLFPPVGQNCRYDALMAAPELDFCSDPASYALCVRRPGGSYMQRAIPDAFRRHGKLLLLEDDMRFHHVKEWDIKRAHTDTPEESAAVMRRNFLLTLFDGCGIQLCDPFKGAGRRLHAFDDPSVLGAMHETVEALAKAGADTTAETGNEVLVLVDPMLRYRWSANVPRNAGTLLALSAELPNNLHTCGVPADLADVRDYLSGDYPHRIVCVADAFALSPSESAELVSRLKRPGLTAFRLDVPEAPSLPAGLDAVTLPKDAAAWHDVLVAKGAHAWAKPGAFLRRRGNLVGVSVAGAGSHRLTLPPTCTGAVELYGKRRFDGTEVVLETKGPETLLFRVSESKNEPEVRLN